jgi:hypothetical protein
MGFFYVVRTVQFGMKLYVVMTVQFGMKLYVVMTVHFGMKLYVVMTVHFGMKLYVVMTVHFGMKLHNDQRKAQFLINLSISFCLTCFGLSFSPKHVRQKDSFVSDCTDVFSWVRQRRENN